MLTVDLQCQDPIIYELMQEEDVNPYQLISAQLQVVKSMEENWCAVHCWRYIMFSVIFGRFQKYLRSLRRGGFYKLESTRKLSVFRHKNYVVIY